MTAAQLRDLAARALTASNTPSVEATTALVCIDLEAGELILGVGIVLLELLADGALDPRVKLMSCGLFLTRRGSVSLIR